MSAGSDRFRAETACGIHRLLLTKTVENRRQLALPSNHNFSPGCGRWGKRAILPIALFAFHNAPTSKTAETEGFDLVSPVSTGSTTAVLVVLLKE